MSGRADEAFREGFEKVRWSTHVKDSLNAKRPEDYVSLDEGRVLFLENSAGDECAQAFAMGQGGSNYLGF